MLPQMEKLAAYSIPVMAPIGFTSQMEHQLSGFRVQGRGEDAQRLIEMVPGEVGRAIT